MGDRICIRLTDGVETTPTFYGHWCGARGLKTMIEAVEQNANTLGGIMCNFIVLIKERETSLYSYDIWDSDKNEGAADGDWWTWTYNLKQKTWVTTHPGFNHRTMTNEEVMEIVRTNRPCLFRNCKCEHYGERVCQLAFYEKHILPQEKKLHPERFMEAES